MRTPNLMRVREDRFHLVSKILKSDITLITKPSHCPPEEYLCTFATHDLSEFFYKSGEWRKTCFVPAAEVGYSVDLPKDPVLNGSFGISSFLTNDAQCRVDFEVLVEYNNSRESVFKKSLDIVTNPTDHGWKDFSVDLSPWKKKKVKLIFKTYNKTPILLQNQTVVRNLPVAGFSNLAVESKEFKPEGYNVILVLVDTLRRDYVGCYNGKNINTPQY